MQVPKREFWNNAEPERLPDAWRMTKQKSDQVLTAVCEVWARRALSGQLLNVERSNRFRSATANRSPWLKVLAKSIQDVEAQIAISRNRPPSFLLWTGVHGRVAISRGHSVVDRDVVTLNVLPGRN
jgi:hypothetical protein